MSYLISLFKKVFKTVRFFYVVVSSLTIEPLNNCYASFVLFLSEISPKRLKVYSKCRLDRSGAQIHDDLFIYAYAFKNNLEFTGSIGKTYFKSHYQLCDLLGLAKPKKILGFTTAALLPSSIYREKEESDINEIFTSDFIKHIQNSISYDKQDNFTVNIHVRRGDVLEKDKKRFLPNSYYLNLIKKIKEIRPDSVLEIYSESESCEGWEEFLKYGCKLNLDTSLVDCWRAFFNSDVLILSHSSFSYVPALYCKGLVIYSPFWHKPIKGWLNIDLQDFEKELECRLKII